MDTDSQVKDERRDLQAQETEVRPISLSKRGAAGDPGSRSAEDKRGAQEPLLITRQVLQIASNTANIHRASISRHILSKVLSEARSPEPHTKM